MKANRTTKRNATHSESPDTPRDHRVSFKPGTRCLPKLCGADIELGNFVAGVSARGGTGDIASKLLLRQIRGFPTGGGSYSAQDWGRKYLKENGGCCYIDLNHLELAQPEVLSAYDHVACWHAMLRIAHNAQIAANDALQEGESVELLVNNSDGLGHSYGSHLDFLITRRAWDDLFHHRIHTLLFLASFQASSIVFTGQGKVGSENDRAAVDYQISQRADFFETLSSLETTHTRPLVNSRNEALCGRTNQIVRGGIPSLSMARLHVIFYDNTLCHVTSLLKVGVMQIILAMIEAGRIATALILDNPLAAVQAWSHDPSLATSAKLINGQRFTAVEHQLRLLENAGRFVDEGGCDGIVPRARDIVELWADTLEKLKHRNFQALTSRLDWVLKLSLIEHALQQHPGWTWQSPELKRLDLMYGSLNNGLYWTCEKQGLTEQIAGTERIEHFMQNPPEDTRAWTRAMLLRKADPMAVSAVDWDELSFRVCDDDGWPASQTVPLPDPLSGTRAQNEQLFRKNELKDVIGELADNQTNGTT